MAGKPRTIHLQKALEKIKRENIDTNVSSEYILLLEQMSVLADINEAYGEQISDIHEVIAEMEASRKLLEQKFDQHLKSNEEYNKMLKAIHDRILDPDDGLIVRSNNIQRRVKDLEDARVTEKQEQKEEGQRAEDKKSDRTWRLIYIVAMSIMVLGIFGSQVGLPLIKLLIAIL